MSNRIVSTRCKTAERHRSRSWPLFAFLAASVALLVESSPAFDHSSPDTLNVRGISIRDTSGRERIRLGETRDGTPGLALMNAKGLQTASFGGVGERTSGFSLRDPELSGAAIGSFANEKGEAGLLILWSEKKEPRYLLQLRENGLIGQRFFDSPPASRRTDPKLALEDVSRVESYVSPEGSSGVSLRGPVDHRSSLSTVVDRISGMRQKQQEIHGKLAAGLALMQTGEMVLDFYGAQAHPRSRFLCQAEGLTLLAFADMDGQWRAFSQSLPAGITSINIGGFEPLPRIEIGFNRMRGSNPFFVLSSSFATGNFELSIEGDRGPAMRLLPKAGQRP